METQKEDPNKEASAGQEDRTPLHEANNGVETPEVASINPALEAARKELLYLRAEFENAKKRMLREQESAIKFANERLVRELLNPIDLLERALSHAPDLKQRKEDQELSSFVTGIELTHRELTQLLGRFSVEFIGTVGEKFDPSRHEAVSQLETPDESKVGTVAAVLQKGCFFNGRLLKPASVIVATKKEN